MTSRRIENRRSRPVGWGLALLTLLLLRPDAVLAADLGDLRIESQPEVEVTWEGVLLGSTDASGVIEISGIPPGTYAVLLRKRGHESRSLPIEVKTGRTELSLLLTPLAPPPEPRRAPVVEPSAPGPTSLSAPQEPPFESVPDSTEPVSTFRDPAPAGESEKARAAATGAKAMTPILAILAAVAGALLIFVIRRARGGAAAREMVPPAPPVPPRAETRTRRTVGDSGIGALREELRRREEALERSEPSGRRAEPEVIDVDDFEIIDGQQ